jgi:glycosyltransferase involved in cell wall biosynthesis
MKILFIIPGSGDSFYCGNCFRDNLHASALKKAGHEVIIMPLYLPFKQQSFQADTPLFFPAATYYIAHKFFGNRKMPGWMVRLTASEQMLNIASSMSGTTSAEGMEKMTLSMITGDDPAFSEHVQALTGWIKEKEQPDIIHLSSTLLLGIAKEIKQKFAIPVVCSLQDEEVWIDSLNKKDASKAWKGIKDNIQYIDGFVTTSQFYKDIVRERIPGIKDITVIYPGIDRKKYASDSDPANPTIGFFYRMNKLNGLDILVDAFVELKKKDTIKNLRLKIGGGFSGKDKQFMKKIRAILDSFMPDVDISDSYSPDDHQDFYKNITVISVPINFNEGAGLYLCEAFAAGRPAVEPATGSFPEIVDKAGILYEHNDSKSLADALEKILTNEKLLGECKNQAHILSETRYNDSVSANNLLNIYKYLIK